MRPPSERQAVQQVRERLAELLGLVPSDAEIRVYPAVPEADAVIDLGRFTFVIEWKGLGALAQVSTAVRQARRYASILGEDAIPLVAVPFMGPVGREHCEEADIGWLDLSGNARIFAPGIRVRMGSSCTRIGR